MFSYEEVEHALGSLAEQRYVESEGDRWKATSQGLAIRETLLGTRVCVVSGHEHIPRL